MYYTFLDYNGRPEDNSKYLMVDHFRSWLFLVVLLASTLR